VSVTSNSASTFDHASFVGRPVFALFRRMR
jgi:hypothetical protein